MTLPCFKHWRCTLESAIKKGALDSLNLRDIQLKMWKFLREMTKPTVSSISLKLESRVLLTNDIFFFRKCGSTTVREMVLSCREFNEFFRLHERPLTTTKRALLDTIWHTADIYGFIVKPL